MDPISHTQASRLADKIRGCGGQELREMMNTEVGSGGSFPAFAPLLWERSGQMRRGQYRFSSFLSLVRLQKWLNSFRTPWQVYLRRGDFPHLITNMEDVQGGRGEEIRDKGVVGVRESSRLEQKASARH